MCLLLLLLLVRANNKPAVAAEQLRDRGCLARRTRSRRSGGARAARLRRGRRFRGALHARRTMPENCMLPGGVPRATRRAAPAARTDACTAHSAAADAGCRASESSAGRARRADNAAATLARFRPSLRACRSAPKAMEVDSSPAKPPKTRWQRFNENAGCVRAGTARGGLGCAGQAAAREGQRVIHVARGVKRAAACETCARRSAAAQCARPHALQLAGSHARCCAARRAGGPRVRVPQERLCCPLTRTLPPLRAAQLQGRLQPLVAVGPVQHEESWRGLCVRAAREAAPRAPPNDLPEAVSLLVLTRAPVRTLRDTQGAARCARAWSRSSPWCVGCTFREYFVSLLARHPARSTQALTCARPRPAPPSSTAPPPQVYIIPVNASILANVIGDGPAGPFGPGFVKCACVPAAPRMCSYLRGASC
jgi:hypothetical protein